MTKPSGPGRGDDWRGAARRCGGTARRPSPRPPCRAGSRRRRRHPQKTPRRRRPAGSSGTRRRCTWYRSRRRWRRTDRSHPPWWRSRRLRCPWTPSPGRSRPGVAPGPGGSGSPSAAAPSHRTPSRPGPPPVARGVGHLELRGLQCLQGRPHPELREARQSAAHVARQVRREVEVADLPRDRRREPGGVERGDRSDPAAAREQRGPEVLGRRAQRGDDAAAGHHHATEHDRPVRRCRAGGDAGTTSGRDNINPFRGSSADLMPLDAL